MKSGICPKCKSTEIYHRPGLYHRGHLGLGVFSTARLEDYLCTKCGFTESYVNNPKKLASAKRNWTRQVPER